MNTSSQKRGSKIQLLASEKYAVVLVRNSLFLKIFIFQKIYFSTKIAKFLRQRSELLHGVGW